MDAADAVDAVERRPRRSGQVGHRRDDGLPRSSPGPGPAGYSLAIDLGTSFVAAAVADDRGLEMFGLGDGSLVSPPPSTCASDGQVVTGEAAARRAVSHPDRVAREIKRNLGNPTPVMLGGVAVRGHRPARARCCRTCWPG